jgi:transcriptional regulator of heat shock response
LSIQSGLVQTIMMKMEAEVSREVLERTAAIINERLHGLSLMEIKHTLDSRIRDLGEHVNPEFVRWVARKAVPMIDQVEPRSLHFGGANNLMRQPEFSDHDKLSSFLHLLESKNIVIQLFDLQILQPDHSLLSRGQHHRHAGCAGANADAVCKGSGAGRFHGQSAHASIGRKQRHPGNDELRSAQAVSSAARRLRKHKDDISIFYNDQGISG